MFWNHRVLEVQDGSEKAYVIAEVFYHEDGSLIGYALGRDGESGEIPWGEDVDELKTTLQWMLDACDKPVLIQAAIDEEFRVTREAREAELLSELENAVPLDVDALFLDLDGPDDGYYGNPSERL